MKQNHANKTKMTNIENHQIDYGISRALDQRLSSEAGRVEGQRRAPGGHHVRRDHAEHAHVLGDGQLRRRDHHLELAQRVGHKATDCPQTSFVQKQSQSMAFAVSVIIIFL